MSSSEKIKPTHLDRNAYVYVRQSTATQVQHNRESTRRQYQLVDRAMALGWPKERVKVIDEDLARSGAGHMERNGFTRMTAAGSKLHHDPRVVLVPEPVSDRPEPVVRATVLAHDSDTSSHKLGIRQ
jgi:hypothetical protein